MSARLSSGWQAGLSCAEAITSLGETLAETALLLRAGLSNVGFSDFVDDQGRRVMLCASPALPADLPARERLLTLAGHALAGVERRLAARRATLHDDDGRAGRPPVLLLCLPTRLGQGGHNGELNATGRDFLGRLRTRLSKRWADAEVEVFPFGRAAGALAMARALQLVDGPRDVVWGGVDSLVDWTVLDALAHGDRLMTMDQVDGLRPGEAAAFAVVTDAARGEALVRGLGLGREAHPVEAETRGRADGFAQALAAAVAPLRGAGLHSQLWVMDATHEAYATREMQHLIGRFGDVLGPRTELRTPLRELGDVGAASVPLLAALTLQDWTHGVAADERAVLCAGSDHGERGAMLLVAAGPGAAAMQENRPDPGEAMKGTMQ